MRAASEPARSSPNFLTTPNAKPVTRCRCWNASTRRTTRSTGFIADPLCTLGHNPRKPRPVPSRRGVCEDALSMARNVAQKLIAEHVVEGEMTPGAEIGVRIDQTLTQDATGTMVMLELEAMDLDRAHTEVSAQYIDHNVLQTDFRNADDHVFLQSACRRFGLWFSKPGNGVSHPVHMQRFGAPGKTMVGSDSHTCAA